MNPLRQLAVGFHNLAQTGASNGSPPMTISALADACDPLLNMINLMGTFSTEAWGEEITAKVGTLRSASNQMTTLEELIDRDIAYNRVRFPNSNSRVLVLVRRSIEGLKVLAEELLTGRDVTLQAAAERAYTDIFHPYHDDTTRFTAAEAISVFPSRELAMLVLGETADEVDNLLRTYVNASALVINYIDGIFGSRGLRTDW